MTEHQAGAGLRDVLERRGLSQYALAKAAGTSSQNINRLVSGEREMTAVWAERLAPFLAVSPEELVFPNLKRTSVPVLSWVSAGRLIAQEGVKRADVKRWTLAADLPRGDWVAFEVSGDSMDRIAPDGASIFVNRSDQRLVNDKFYVFQTDEGEATFKRYRSGNPARLQPFSTNPDHETITVTGQLSVIGRVGRVVNDLP